MAIAQDAPAGPPAPSPLPDERPRRSLTDLAARETRSRVARIRLAPVIYDALADEARRRKTSLSRLGELGIVNLLLSLDPRNVVPPRTMSPVEQLLAAARATGGAAIVELSNAIVIVVARDHEIDHAATSATTTSP